MSENTQNSANRNYNNVIASEIIVNHNTFSANGDRDRQLAFNQSFPRNLQILSQISLLILQSLNQENPLSKAISEIRQALQADRVLVYRFETTGKGAFAAESIADGWSSILTHECDDVYYHYDQKCQSTRIHTTNNIYEAGLEDSYVETLSQFDIKAQLIVPLVKDDRLLGSLIAHQCSKPREWRLADIDLFIQTAIPIVLAMTQIAFQVELQTEAKRAKLLIDLPQLIRRSLKLADILKTTVNEVRQAVKTDRVLVYRFKTDWSGTIIAESVAPGYPPALRQQIDDPCFRDRYVEQYQSGRVHAINNIYKAGLTKCHIKMLEQFTVKANLVAPVISDNQLLGLLIAHQCSQPREWTQGELDFMAQVAIQVGFALDKATLLENKEAEAERVRVFQETTQLIRKSLKPQDIIKVTVREVRQALKTDRILIYCFRDDGDGIVEAESVAEGFPQTLKQEFDDPCFRERYIKLYQKGRVRALNNIYDAGLTACHINSLERFAVKASAIAPIIKNSKLFGLLIAHQCSGIREWQKTEIDLLAAIATQVGYALEQAQLQEHMEQITQIANQVTTTLKQPELQPERKLRHTELEILNGNKDYDVEIRFAGLPWQQ